MGYNNEEKPKEKVMSINDPIKLYYNNRRGTWIFMQGKETFYDKTNRLMEFDTVEQALEWAGEHNHQVSEDSFPDLGVDAPEGPVG